MIQQHFTLFFTAIAKMHSGGLESQQRMVMVMMVMAMVMVMNH